jgi:hypothetical protein
LAKIGKSSKRLTFKILKRFEKDPLGFGVSVNMVKAAYCDHVGHYKCLIKSIADENCLIVSGDPNL